MADESEAGARPEWFVHGGRLRAAAAAFPDAPRPWIDLSTGLNPQPWQGKAGEVDWGPLPDAGDLLALEATAAAHFGAPPAHVCALPGTEIGLRLLGSFGLPKPVSVVAPGYSTHLDAFAGARPIGIAAIDDAAADGGTLLLANPNNPDGRLLSPERLIALASRLRERQGLLIVDEAFADMADGVGLAPYLTAELAPHVVLLRSFGKFFGLGGLRLGFAIADETWRASFRHRLGSWPLSAAALAFGTGAYRDRAWIEATRHRLVEDAARLDALLAAHGLAARGACPLFRLVDTPDAQIIFQRLMRHGLLTRPFAYAPRWLRFGLPGDETAWERLDRALADG